MMLFIVYAMQIFIHQRTAFFQFLSILLIACACGGGGSGTLSQLDENGDVVSNFQTGNRVLLKANIVEVSKQKNKRSKSSNEVFITNPEGDKIVMNLKSGSEYSANVLQSFISGPLLIDAKMNTRNLRKVVFETAVEGNGELDLGLTDRRSTSFSYIVENAINSTGWLKALKEDGALVSRFKTQEKTLVSDNIIINDLQVKIRGTGKMTVLSHLGNIMFDNKTNVVIDHNSNVEKIETFSLVKSGPADLLIMPAEESKLYSIKVTKGVIDYESGASYNTKYKYYENSTFIDHLELGFFAQDIVIELEFRWLNNSAPAITSTPEKSVVLDKTYTYQIAANDANGDTMTYELLSGPNGMSIDNTGNLTWTANVWGDSKVSVLVSDSYITSTQNYTLSGVNNPPVFTSIPVRTATVGTAYSYTALATDVDGDTLLYELTNSPTDMTIGANTGIITWTPTAAGSNIVEVKVRDNRDSPFFNYVYQSFTLTTQP